MTDRRFPLLLIVFLCLSDHVASGQFPTHVEEFTTTDFRNAPVTTAVWDTSTGTLRLADFTPTVLGSASVPGTPISLTVRDGYAYVGTETAGLRVVDIQDPSAPVVVATVSGSSRVEGVDLDGGLGIFASGSDAFFVFSAQDPTLSLGAGSSSIGGETHDVDIEDRLVYVASGSAGLNIIGESSGLIATHPTDDASMAVHVDGDVAWVAQGSVGIEAVDITESTTPTSSILLSGTQGAIDLFAEGDVVYAVTDDGTVLVIEDVYTTPVVHSLALGGSAFGLEVQGDRIFVAAGTAGVHVVDMTDRTMPTLLRTIGGIDARAVRAVGPTLAVADANGFLGMVGWASAGALAFRAITYTGDEALDGVRRGDVVWTAGSSIRAYDVSDATSPTALSSIGASGSFRGIDVAGTHAYATTSGSLMQVYDIADPANPTYVDAVFGLSDSRAVTVRGDLAFVTGRPIGAPPMLFVVDVSDPTAPTLLSTWFASSFVVECVDVVATRDRVYLAGEEAGVWVLDVSDPANPFEVVRLPPLGDEVHDLALEGFHLYVAEGNEGIRVIDTRTLTTVGVLDVFEDVRTLSVEGRRLVASTDRTTQVIDVSDPTDPRALWFSRIGNEPSALLLVDGENVFTSDGIGLWVSAQYSDAFDAATGQAASLPFYSSGDDEVVSVRADVVGTGRYTLYATTPNVQPLTLGTDEFQFLSSPTQELGWFASLDPYLTTGSSMDRITIEWRTRNPAILGVDDVPDDQGGWLRVRILGSGYDTGSSPSIRIQGYNVMRRVDDLGAQVVAEGTSVDEEAVRLADGSEVFGPTDRLVRIDERVFVNPNPGLARSIPAGTWEIVGSFFATSSDDYLFLAPASSDPSVFVVSAHTTNGEFFTSAPDSGTATDDIAPGVPTGLAVAYAAGGNAITWDPAPETDFQYHRVYRATDPGFVPSSSNLVHETATNGWTDGAGDSWNWTYKVTTLDAAGNESEAATIETATATPATRSWKLLPARPNPFNPRTKIAFDVPRDGLDVELTVHDVAGRRVRTLYSGRAAAGRHEVVWSGDDDRGAAVGSGVYFARLHGPSVELRTKLLLVQ